MKIPTVAVPWYRLWWNQIAIPWQYFGTEELPYSSTMLLQSIQMPVLALWCMWKNYGLIMVQEKEEWQMLQVNEDRRPKRNIFQNWCITCSTCPVSLNAETISPHQRTNGWANKTCTNMTLTVLHAWYWDLAKTEK